MDEPRHRKLKVLAEDRVRFRDPPKVAADLKRKLARLVARADSLPIALPGTDLSLVDIDADRRGIELIFGAPDEVGRVRMEGEDIVTTVSLGAVRSADRHRPFLERAAERLKRSLDAARWSEAMSVARELASAPSDVPMTFARQMVEGIDHPTGLVRVGFRCNQDCGICWQGRDWGGWDRDTIVGWIEDLAVAGAKHLMISGGEPTLDRDLTTYVRRAKELGFARVTIETNAILIARGALGRELREAGLDSAFVSLHSGDAAISDAITRAPGTHARTVAGIHALLDAGIDVELNAVLTKEGIAHVVELPSFVADEFGAHPRLRSLMLSFPTVSFDRSLVPAILPDLPSLRAALRGAIDVAVARGVPVRGLDGPCGPPLCAFDADPRVRDHGAIPGPVAFRRHLDPCGSCAAREGCFGAHDMAATLFGDDAVRPLP